MSYEEWKNLTALMLDFYRLPREHRESVMLMIDGLKYRSEKPRQDGGGE